jgi:hypothetical protein
MYLIGRSRCPGEWKKPTTAVIFHCIDTGHSAACFGTSKCHHQGVNHDPAEIGAQCCRNQKDRLKYIVKGHKMYINGAKGGTGAVHWCGALVWCTGAALCHLYTSYVP